MPYIKKERSKKNMQSSNPKLANNILSHQAKLRPQLKEQLAFHTLDEFYSLPEIAEKLKKSYDYEELEEIAGRISMLRESQKNERDKKKKKAR